MQSLISEWILEFLLLQPIEDYLANSLLRVLPLRRPLPARLRRILLLRRLASDLSRCSFSLRTFHTLELTHSLALSPRPQLLCSAYAAVAVHCAAEHLRPNSADTEDAVDFFDAVNRIFNCRVTDLERSEAAGLVSEELRAARREMEAAVVDRRIRGEVAARDTKAAAVGAIRSYLKFELEEMGSPFIERLERVVEGEGLSEEALVEFRNQIVNDLKLQSNVCEEGSEG